MTRIAIIHTSPATLEPLKTLAAELLPGVEVVNFLDDSILLQLKRNGGHVAELEERLVNYARFAEQAGAQAVLEACSSVGELVPSMQAAIGIPVVRIDTAMAEEAVRRASRIGVAATLATTLEPTLRLLEAKAAEAGKTITLTPRLVASAFERLAAGDRDGHDGLVVEALATLIQEVDIVVLAQASMARVLPRLPEAEREKFLTSPRAGMLRVKAALAQAAGQPV